MKIIIQKNILEKILIATQAFLEKKDLSQITSHILIEARNNKVIIKATDYEIGIQIQTDCEIEKEGIATSNGKKLLDAIKYLKEEDILFYTEEETLFMEQKNTKFQTPMFKAKEFPNFPRIEEKFKLPIENLNFTKGLKKAIPSIDTNNTKYELGGVLLDFLGDHYNIISTDTKRLSVIQTKEEIKNSKKIILPKRSILEALKLIHENTNLYFNDKNFIIENKNTIFFTKVINGNFPQYQGIIPNEIQNEIKLQKKIFLESTHMIASLSNIIVVNFKEKEIIMTTSKDSQSKAKTLIQLKENVPKFKIVSNAKYFIDFLNSIEGDEFTISINEEMQPFMLSSGNFKTIIMPILE